MTQFQFTPVGAWYPGNEPAALTPDALVTALQRFREPTHVVRDPSTGRVGIAHGGTMLSRAANDDGRELQLLATLPATYPEWLGDRSFLEVHNVRFPYIAGEMANGIATPALVIAMARAGMLGFYGAGGLSRQRIEEGLDEIQGALKGTGFSWGVNLIHSPAEPELEHAAAEMFIRRGVDRVCASAFMGLTPSVVRYAVTGLTRDADGRIQRKHHVFAKLSRPEVARRFVMPAPADMLQELVAKGEITAAEAAIAAFVPIAEDVTVEADSGGHTDNRPLGALFPLIRSLVDEVARTQGYSRPIRVGAAGGLGTPASVASAFALGAAYVVTGSVNQSAVEAGLSLEGKKLLAQAGVADVIMAPAADMFELGVKLQVLRRGTMFAQRAAKLYEVYIAYDSPEAIPQKLRQELETQIFRVTLDEVWADTQRFFEKRDPTQLTKAAVQPKHRLALILRWYLGRSSRWAIDGDPTRKLDYQIWCGPAQGAFNEWAKGSFVEPVENRTAVQIALNLLEGAAVVARAQQLRSHGAALPAGAFEFRPRRIE
jgi:PfaD family protein